MKATHFKIDARQLTLRECWWQTRSPAFFILVLLKLLRIRLPMPGLLPFISRISDLEVPHGTIEPGIFDLLLEHVHTLHGLGFHSPVFYRYGDSRGAQVVHIVALLHESGEMMARIMHTEVRTVQPPRRKLKVVFLARLMDGTWFFGSAGRPEFISPPRVDGVRRVGAPPAVLLHAFRKELDRRRIANPPSPIRDRVTAERLSDEYETLHQEFNVRRGLYAPVAEAEVEQEQEQVAAQAQSAVEVGPENAAVLAEVGRLLNQKPTWSGSLWMLVVSIIAFVGLGSAQWDFKFALLLVPILFVHEAGHWLAMRAFGYSNLRMFFIPLFGAAVTGRHFNVPGWKKALVSLAGPAPGIFLGSALAFSSIWLSLHGFERMVGIAILLNVINLVPFLPLDGGWYLNAILFCRHPVLETGFKVFAVVGLFAASAKTGDRIWMFLGILLVLSLGSTWRLSRLAARLRREEIPTQSQDQRTIPLGTALRIIEVVRASTPQARSSKVVAAEVLEVFERLNARPPGWLGTLALLVAYAAVIGVGFLGFGASALARNPFALAVGDPDAYHRLHPLNPGVHVACGEVARWRGAKPQPSRTNQVVLMAAFPSGHAAEAAWPGFTNEPLARASRVGPVLFGVLPAGSAAAKFAEGFPSLGTNILSIDTRTNYVTPVPLVFTAPDEAGATNLARELTEYFCLPDSFDAIPPWQQGATLSPAQQDVRYTYRRLDEAGDAIGRDRELRQAQQALLRSYSLTRTSRMQEAAAKLQGIRNRLWEAAENDLLNSKDPRLVREVVQEHRRDRLAESDDSRRKALVHRVDPGLLPEDDTSTSGAARSLAATGYLLRQGTRLEVRGLLFAEPDLGLPALVDWLCARGCRDIRVDLMQR
jgi:Zn-dependent protease